MLTIIVSPAPLKGVTIGRDDIKLVDAEVARWTKNGRRAPGRLELEGHQPITQATRAGAQTLYYNPKAKPGVTTLLRVQLRYGRIADLI
jgi:hypothetical protein